MRIGPETFNVLQLGLGFLLIFFASDAQSAIKETIIDQKHKAGVLDEYAGYISSGISYGAFTFSNFVSAPIVRLLGPRWALVIGAVVYALFQAGFFFLNEPFLYITSILVGLASGLIWTAQGKYIAINSTDNTAGTHSSLFWGMSQLCLVGSGAFLYFAFRDLKDNDTIDDSTLNLLYGVFTAVSVAGVVVFGLLRIPERDEPFVSPELEPESKMTFKEGLYSTFKLLTEKRILFLAASFIYIGVEVPFRSGIYPSAISFTKKLATNTKAIVALNTISQGIGQVTAGFLFGILGGVTKKLGRITVILIGLVAHFLAFVAAYLNFPNDAPLGKTEKEGIIKPPNVAIALICGYLLGFGNACWNTQIFSLLVAKYNKKSAEAFALFFGFQSLTTAIAFIYASYFTMVIHILVLVVVVILGFIGFSVAEKLPTPTEEVDEHSTIHVD
ncbi:hypothetical protein FO519_007732 [Halicephalobus sp. NKZ332]|nr:hypothetical protein FO519_007732 [Halicephalobus sp. NKZ332]